jgi:hypothetical protein
MEAENDNIEPQEAAQEVDTMDDNKGTSTPLPEVTTYPVQATRSGRKVTMPSRYDEFVVYHSISQIDGCGESNTEYTHPLALSASSDSDIMYMEEALRAPDRSEFIKAMKKEVNAHTDNKNWRIIP